MLTLCATRFTSVTWAENAAYRHKKKFVGCVYGVPRMLAHDILPHAPVAVVEMNNTARRVEGIGMVPNTLYPGRAWIYNEGRYNMYTYISRFRLDRKELADAHLPGHPSVGLLWFLEQLVFGKAELKGGPPTHGLRMIMRGTGITRLPRWLFRWPRTVKIRRRRLLVVHDSYDLRELIHSEFMKKFPGATEFGLAPSQLARALREDQEVKELSETETS